MGRKSNYADQDLNGGLDERNCMDTRAECRLHLENPRAFIPSEGQEEDGVEGGAALRAYGGDWSWRPPAGVPNMSDEELNKHLLHKYPNARMGVPPVGFDPDSRLDAETLRAKITVSKSDANMPLGKTRWWTLGEYNEYQLKRRLDEQSHV